MLRPPASSSLSAGCGGAQPGALRRWLTSEAEASSCALMGVSSSGGGGASSAAGRLAPGSGAKAGPAPLHPFPRQPQR